MPAAICHIARQPTPPSGRAAAPEPLPSLTMKLLAKNAEERYQTAGGVEADLRRRLAEWESLNRIDPFPPGAHDSSDRLLIPEKLYGREPVIDALLEAFDRVVAGGAPELVLVSGYSGVGKSSVVSELHKVLVPRRGFSRRGSRPGCQPAAGCHPAPHFGKWLRFYAAHPSLTVFSWFGRNWKRFCASRGARSGSRWLLSNDEFHVGYEVDDHLAVRADRLHDGAPPPIYVCFALDQNLTDQGLAGLCRSRVRDVALVLCVALVYRSLRNSYRSSVAAT
jgi:hypothetical protein